jgi:hypothetical protein
LKPHEIEAFITEPSKRSGELLDGYKIALDPAKWEEEQELKRANAEEEEANAEVDQLDGETDGLDADGDADADEAPSKSKKRKREETKSKVRTKASAKKDKDADSVKRKAAGKRNGARSKALVESEDDGAAEADGDDDDDAGPSKRAASPPAAKKPKKDDDRACLIPFNSAWLADVPCLALASDPEAVRVRDWRHKLQKTFLNDKGTGPKPEVSSMFPLIFFCVRD